MGVAQHGDTIHPREVRCTQNRIRGAIFYHTTRIEEHEPVAEEHELIGAQVERDDAARHSVCASPMLGELATRLKANPASTVRKRRSVIGSPFVIAAGLRAICTRISCGSRTADWMPAYAGMTKETSSPRKRESRTRFSSDTLALSTPEPGAVCLPQKCMRTPP